MGGKLSDIRPELLFLIGLMIVYGALAMLSCRIFLPRYTANEKILHRGTPGVAQS